MRRRNRLEEEKENEEKTKRKKRSKRKENTHTIPNSCTNLTAENSNNNEILYKNIKIHKTLNEMI